MNPTSKQCLLVTLCIVVALTLIAAGFYKTYFTALPQHFFDISWYVHLHAGLGVAWVLLLFTQLFLIKNGRRSLHRRMGRWGMALFALFLLSALPMAFFIWLRGDRFLQFVAISEIALSAAFFAGGMFWRKKTAIHSRLMAATGLVLIDPVAGRIAGFLLELPGQWGNHLPFLLINGLLLAFIFWDKKRGLNFKPWLFVLGCFLVYETASYTLAAKWQPAATNLKSMDLLKIEHAEIIAWLDLFAAQPETWKQEQGASSAVVDGVSLFTCKKIPFPHFNLALDLGVNQPLDENTLERILAHFRSEGIGSFYLQSTPIMQPPQASEWFVKRGMRHVSSWHRIARSNEPLAEPSKSKSNYTVEEVNGENDVEWAQFIDNVYGMPTGKWLLELPGRPGWHHVVCREAGKIVAARSMKINPDGTAYFMIDAPAPGIMTQNFEADYLLARRLLEIGLANGVQLFTADIEKPSPMQDTPAYRYWSALGFSVAYEKRNFMF
jgi:hypothetical protein